MVGLKARANENRPLFGIALILLAYLMFSCVDTGTKWLNTFGHAVMQLAFMRYFGHFSIASAVLMRNGVSLEPFKSERLMLVVLRGLLLMLSTVCNFYAVTYLSLTLTATIQFSAPIIICALSWPLLGERVGPWRWGAILFGFMGIIIAIKPFDAEFHWAVGLSVISALCFAFYSIITRKLAGIVADNTMQFYTGLVGTVCLLPFALALWQTPETTLQWAVMIAIGAFAWVGHQVLTRAHGFAPASTLMPFGYSFILYLTVWSYVIFNQVPNEWTLLGAAMIIAAGLFIWHCERQMMRDGLKAAQI